VRPLPSKRWSIYRKRGVEFTEKNVARNPEAVQELMSWGTLAAAILIGDQRSAALIQSHDEALAS